jgi:hypothetical protein
MSKTALVVFVLFVSLRCVPEAHAQIAGERGFIQAGGSFFPDTTLKDSTQVVGDLLVRDEGFVKPAKWLQFAAGFDLRANSHDQVDSSWSPDFSDRGTLRPRLSVRRLNATITHGPLTLDLGKQFIRWGKTDIVTPTDRFAPRDFINVTDNDFLAVTGARGVFQWKSNTFDAVWVPQLTPSRIPLLDQRWTSVGLAATTPLVDGGAVFPDGSETGLRWSHTGRGYEYSTSFFNGFNHLPNITPQPVFAPNGMPIAAGIFRTYPTLRMYGMDAAVPTPWFTIKGEAAYSTTTTAATDEYVVYVVQLERQTGEWLLVGGYAGEDVTHSGWAATFAPDRGLTRSFLARASYTIDPNRTAALETAIRQNGHGLVVKGELSQARGQHWRASITGSLIRGDADDFLGQYRLNSHVAVALRYSF